MTEQQKAFCEYYIALGNATEAAKKAGYSVKTAYSSGQRLLKHVEIKKHIEEQRIKACNERIADANEVLEFFTEVMRNKVYNPKDRLKAAERLSLFLGIDKQAPADDAKTQLDKLCDAIRGAKE